MSFITVEEAKKKFCPFLRPEYADDGTCDADKCMMWRWDNLPYYEGDSDQPTPRGYCGLAGFPQRGGLP